MIKDNICNILENIEKSAKISGRKADDITLVAVTKTVESVYINKAIEVGADLIGENRVQEYLGKKDELNLDGVEKHLIGHLQTNKVKQIVGEVDMIESVDSIKLAKEISRVSVNKGVDTNILVEVNVGKEDSKSGVYMEQLEELLVQIAALDNVKIRGLMTIPPI